MLRERMQEDEYAMPKMVAAARLGQSGEPFPRQEKMRRKH